MAIEAVGQRTVAPLVAPHPLLNSSTSTSSTPAGLAGGSTQAQDLLFSITLLLSDTVKSTGQRMVSEGGAFQSNPTVYASRLLMFMWKNFLQYFVRPIVIQSSGSGSEGGSEGGSSASRSSGTILVSVEVFDRCWQCCEQLDNTVYASPYNSQHHLHYHQHNHTALTTPAIIAEDFIEYLEAISQSVLGIL